MRFLDMTFRSGDRRIPTQVLVPTLCIVFSKFLNWLVFPSPTIHPDSATYAPREWLNFELVSFSGDAVRGWPIPLIYAIIPSPSLQVLFQLTFSAFAWVCLLIAVQSLFPNRISSWFFSVALTVLAVTPFGTQWDTVLLGTSIMLSSNLLIISVILHIWKKPGSQYTHLVLFVLLDAFIFLQKSSNIPLCLLYAAIVFLSPLKTVGKLRKVSLLLFFGLVMSYGALVGNNVDKKWDFSYSGTTLLWQLGSQSPSSTSFKEFLQNQDSVPKCVYDRAPYPDINSEIVTILSDCPEAGTYVRDNLKIDFARFLITNPDQAVRLIAVSAGAVSTASSSNYGKSVSIFPRAADQLIFGETSPSLRSQGVSNQEKGLSTVFSGDPLWIYAPTIGWILFGMFSGLVILRSRESSQANAYLLVNLIIISSLVQFSISSVLLPSEWVRQSSPYVFPLLALLALNIAIFLGLKTKR